MLNAKIVTPFPDNVTFERQSRWNIRLDVIPASTDYSPSFVDTNAGYDSLHRDQHMHTPVYDVSPVSMRAISRASDLETVVHKGLDTGFNRPSPQKRKVSQPISDDAFYEIKRRRQGLTDPVDNKLRAQPISSMNICTPLSEANSLRAETSDDCGTPNSELQTQAMALVVDFLERMKAAGSVADRYHVISANDASKLCRSRMGQIDSSMASLNTDPSSPNISVPDSAVDMDHIDLQQQQIALEQEQILRNYQEFSERKLRKNAGIISPVSDGERRAFEDIFLEDSPGWSPITECSTDQRNTTMEEI